LPVQVLRIGARVVVAAKDRPLARRDELSVDEVLDETFCGTSRLLEPVRAGFWMLDDHRGEPAPYMTADQTLNPHEVVACIASGRAIITAPASNATNFLSGLDSVVTIPLKDAKPATLTLTW